MTFRQVWRRQPRLDFKKHSHPPKGETDLSLFHLAVAVHSAKDCRKHDGLESFGKDPLYRISETGIFAAANPEGHLIHRCQPHDGFDYRPWRIARPGSALLPGAGETSTLRGVG